MSESAAASPPTPASPLRTFGWAAYLACSWTWCIGMFLPVLLVRDYGVWGFVVFAVPNVIGAAAMGWVLKDGASERIAEKHKAACATFSIVTIAFQAYFAGWFLFRIDRTSGYTAQHPLVVAMTLASFACGFAAWKLIKNGKHAWRLGMSVLVLATSVVAGVALLNAGVLDSWKNAQFRAGWGQHPDRMAWMAPVCVFGFALCPYLDLTFLRARQSQTRAASRQSFSFGFGVLFAGMILLTLAYAPLALGLMGYPLFRPAAFALIIPLAIHLFVQVVATITLHLDELVRLPRELSQRSIAVLLVLVILAACACFSIDWQVDARLEMLVGEIIYRCFMSFYGLVFPAYVWLCMIPTGDGHSGIDGAQGRRKLIVLAVAIALAAPCFWMGFIERIEWWLAPGLGVVLLSRLLVLGSRGKLNVPSSPV